jgi:hypothetical protein
MTRFPVPEDDTAAKMFCCGDQAIALQFAEGTSRRDHSIPSRLTMALDPLPTATKYPSSADQATENQSLFAADALETHVIPSRLVITRLPSPVVDTATSKPSSRAHTTENQLLSAADSLGVHVTPSGLVITRSPVPSSATATNSPISAAHVTERHRLSGVVCNVQLMPSALVMQRLAGSAVDRADTATNRFSSGDQHTECQLLSAGDTRRVHVNPLGLVMMRLPVPLVATATNSAASFDQHTEIQLLSATRVVLLNPVISVLVVNAFGPSMLTMAVSSVTVPAPPAGSILIPTVMPTVRPAVEVHVI